MTEASPSPAIVVLGPTASGKTSVAVALARRLNGEIISADSRQVYRGLDIGSGKDLDEYGDDVPYHLIDVVDIEDEYHVFRFQQECHEALNAIRARGNLPILCGGTGMYLESVLLGYAMSAAPEDSTLRSELDALSDDELRERLRTFRPDTHNTTDLTDRSRTIRAIEIAAYEVEHPPPTYAPLEARVIGILWPRPVLRKRIRKRLDARMNAGLVEEVEGLLARGISRDRLFQLGLEYRYVTQYLDGELGSRNDLVQKLASAIGQFAKRQETWFRRMERRGTPIHWVDGGDTQAMIAAAQK